MHQRQYRRTERSIPAKNRRPRARTRVTLVEILEVRYLLAIDTTIGPTNFAAAVATPTFELWNPAGSSEPNGSAGPTGYGPNQIAQAYGYNQILFSGGIVGTGAGQTIAIVDAYDTPTIAHDLQAFDAFYGIPDPPSFIRVAQDGSTNYPGVDPAGAGHNNWEVETALDVEWAHALAPQANILLVEAKTNGADLDTAVDFARNYPGVSVISMSWGSSEFASDDPLFTTPTGHTPITFIASTGDSGAPGEYPATSPNVLAVGGTTLTLNAANNISGETGWSGSGGGISTLETQPTYQTGVVTQSTSRRTIPDVSFDANPSTGAAIYDSYNNGTTTPWTKIGGTSFSAPSWAALIAIADQGRVAAGFPTLNGRNDTLPALYSMPSTYFHDITSGNNGFAAGPGYDLVTGRGSPVANLIAPALVTSQNIVGTVFDDTNDDGIPDGTETGLAGWTVYQDVNNNGVLDPPAYTTVSSSGSPLTIPDGSGNVTSTLTVGALAGSIMDLNVNLSIQHARDSNLTVTLISPSGTSIPLVSHSGGTGQNFTNTTFDDQAGTAITSGTAPFNGSFRPASPLSAVIGQNAQGNWRLVVSDTVSGNTGVLNNWSLSVLTASEPTTTTDSGGHYLFRNVPAGTYNIRAIPPAGFTQVSPAGGVNTVTVTPGVFAPAQDFAEEGSSISGETFLDADGNGQLDSGEIPFPTGTFDDLNNNGVFDLTSQYTVASTAAPQPIPDQSTILSTLNAVGMNGTITDLNVTLSLNHANDSDLAVTLITPDGTYIPLINHNGGSGANFVSTTLDDQATTAIASGVAPFTGSFKPASPLSAANGKNPNGTWELLVADTVAGNTGTLQSWSLQMTTNASEPLDFSDANGNYQFSDLTAGTHNIRQLPNGYGTSEPAGGAYVVNVSSPVNVTGENFGNVSPLVVSGGGPYTITEGNSLALNGSAGNGNAPYTLGWDLNGDGTFTDASGATPTLTSAQLAALGITGPGTYNIRLEATDSSGVIGESLATTLTVLPPPPTAGIAGSITVLRGETNTYTLSASDAELGPGTSFTFVIDWGDGTALQTVSGQSGQHVTHTFNAVGTPIVSVTASDLNGTSLAATQSVNVSAVLLRPDAQNAALVDLVWGGDSGDDQVQFTQIAPATIRVQESTINGASVNNVQDFSGVTGRVLASGNGGNDVLDASGLLTTSATLDGGAGNNTLYGGSAGDILIGGSNGAEGKQGNNVIIAGDGNNTIYGNGLIAQKGVTGGNNLIIGGTGQDTIYGNFGANPTGNGGEGGQNLIVGNGGGDTIYSSQITDGAEGGHGSILIAGTTNLGPTALQAILSEWTSTDTLAVKIANISGTGSGTAANGTNYLQPGVTVSNDGVPDTLFSDSKGSANWLLASLPQDTVNRVKSSDTETNLP
ncbi:MAG TPA: proprotein convertase P-domain-containing protein [Pirellulales bacterium]|nr:proprotein convertase P-domain-containing protein [Pirellulales bacterium]